VCKKAAVACAKVFPAYYVETDHNLENETATGRGVFCTRSLLTGIDTSICCIMVSRVAQSVQCLATGWTIGRSRFDPRQRQMIFPLASVSIPALGPTQPPMQWVSGVISPGVKRGRGVTVTTHPIWCEVENE
jgi:hypothetical protein